MSYDWKFHCAVLCVPEQASLKEIKQAYHKLALRCHPDQNGNTPQANEKFQRLNASYRYLVRNHGSRPRPNYYRENAGSPPPNPEPPKPPRETSPPPFDWQRGWKKFREFWAVMIVRGRNNLALKSLKRRNIAIALGGIASAITMIGICAHIFGSQPQPLAQNSTESRRNPATTRKLNAHGYPIDSCETESILIGRPTEKERENLGENDCYLKCLEWFEKHSTMNSVCYWAGKEFRQHEAVPDLRRQASAAWYQANNAPSAPARSPTDRLTEPRIFYNPGDPPAGFPPPEPERLTITLGQDYLVELDFVPAVWVEDQYFLEANYRKFNPRQIFIAPKRKGTCNVWFQDADSLRRHIIFEIQ